MELDDKKMSRESRHVRISGLPEGMGEERIRTHFSIFGNVHKICQAGDGSSDIVISFNDIRSAQKAIVEYASSKMRLDKENLLSLKLCFSDSVPSTPTGISSLPFHPADIGRFPQTSEATASSSRMRSSTGSDPAAEGNGPTPSTSAGAGNSTARASLAIAARKALGCSPAAVIAEPLHKNAARTLFVSNLPSGITDDELKEIFTRFNYVLDCDVKNRHSASPSAFLEFTDIDSVVKAIRASQGLQGQHHDPFIVGGKRLELRWGKTVRSNKLWIGALPSTCSQQYLFSKLRVIERAEDVSELIYDAKHREALALYKSTEASQLAYHRIKGKGLTFPPESGDEDPQYCQVDFCSEKLHDFFVDRQFGRVPKVSRTRLFQQLLAPPPDPPLGVISDTSDSIRSSPPQVLEETANPSSSVAAAIPPDPVIRASRSASASTQSQSGKPQQLDGKRPEAKWEVKEQAEEARSRLTTPGGGRKERKQIRPPSPDQLRGERLASREKRSSQAPIRTPDLRGSSHGSGSTPRHNTDDDHHHHAPMSRRHSGEGRSELERPPRPYSVGGSRGERTPTTSREREGRQRTMGGHLLASSSSGSSSSIACSSRSTSTTSTSSASRERNGRSDRIRSSLLVNSSSSSRLVSASSARRQERRVGHHEGETDRRSHRRKESPFRNETLCPPPPAPTIDNVQKTAKSHQRRHSGSSTASSSAERYAAKRPFPSSSKTSSSVKYERSAANGRNIEDHKATGDVQSRRIFSKHHTPSRTTDDLEKSKRAANTTEGGVSSRDEEATPSKPTVPSMVNASQQQNPTTTAAGQAPIRTPPKKEIRMPLSPSPQQPPQSDPRRSLTASIENQPDLPIPLFGQNFLARRPYVSLAISPISDHSDSWLHEGGSQLLQDRSSHTELGSMRASTSKEQAAAWKGGEREDPFGSHPELLSRNNSTTSLPVPASDTGATQFTCDVTPSEMQPFRLNHFSGRGDILQSWRQRLVSLKVSLDTAEAMKEEVLVQALTTAQARIPASTTSVAPSMTEELEKFRNSTKESESFGEAHLTATLMNQPNEALGSFSSSSQQQRPTRVPSAEIQARPEGADRESAIRLVRNTPTSSRVEKSVSTPHAPIDSPFSSEERPASVQRDPRSKLPSFTGSHSSASTPSALVVEQPWRDTSASPSCRATIAPSVKANSSGSTAKVSFAKKGVDSEERTPKMEARSSGNSDRPKSTPNSSLRLPPPTHSGTKPHHSGMKRVAEELDDLFRQQANESRTLAPPRFDERHTPFADSGKFSLVKAMSSRPHHSSSSSKNSADGAVAAKKAGSSQWQQKQTPKHGDKTSVKQQERSAPAHQRGSEDRHGKNSSSREAKENEKKKKRKKRKHLDSSGNSTEGDNDDDGAFGFGSVDLDEQRRILEQIASGTCGTTMYDRVKQRSSALRPTEQRKKEKALEKIREKAAVKKKKLQRVQLSTSDEDSDRGSQGRMAHVASKGGKDRHGENASDSEGSASRTSRSTVLSRSEGKSKTYKQESEEEMDIAEVNVEIAPVTSQKAISNSARESESSTKQEAKDELPLEEERELVVAKAEKPPRGHTRSGMVSELSSESEGEACVRQLREELMKHQHSSEEEAVEAFEAGLHRIIMEDIVQADFPSAVVVSAPANLRQPNESDAMGGGSDEDERKKLPIVPDSFEDKDEPSAKRAKVEECSADEGDKTIHKDALLAENGMIPEGMSNSNTDRKPKRGRPPKVKRRLADDSETKKREEKKIVEILHSFGYGDRLTDVDESPLTAQPSTDSASTSQKTFTPPTPQPPSMDGLLASATSAVQEGCGGFEVLDQGTVVQQTGPECRPTSAPKEKRGRGRPRKNKQAPRISEQDADRSTTKEESLDKRAELMRRMRDEEEAAAAMNLTQIQTLVTPPKSRQIERVDSSNAHGGVLSPTTTGSGEKEIRKTGPVRYADAKAMDSSASDAQCGSGGYMEVDADLLQHQQKELEEQERLAEEKRHFELEEEKERKRLELEQRRRFEDDRLAATVDAVIASNLAGSQGPTPESTAMPAERRTEGGGARYRSQAVVPLTPASTHHARATYQRISIDMPPAENVQLASGTGSEPYPLASSVDMQDLEPNLLYSLPEAAKDFHLAVNIGNVGRTMAGPSAHISPFPILHQSPNRPPSMASLPPQIIDEKPFLTGAQKVAAPSYASSKPVLPTLYSIPPQPSTSPSAPDVKPAVREICPSPLSIQTAAVSGNPAVLQSDSSTLEKQQMMALYQKLLESASTSHASLSPNTPIGLPPHLSQASYLINAQLGMPQSWGTLPVVPPQHQPLGVGSTSSGAISLLQQANPGQISQLHHSRDGHVHLHAAPSLQHLPSDPHGLQLGPASPLSATYDTYGEVFNTAHIQNQYPVVWQGQLVMKNAQTLVEMHKVCGNGKLLTVMDSELVSLVSGIKTIKITQRMRLEEAQLQNIERKMCEEQSYVGLCCIPCGREAEDLKEQSEAMRLHFIDYFLQKQAAGIVNQGPGYQSNYVAHVFPPVKFVTNIMLRVAPDFLMKVEENNAGYLFVVICCN